MSFTLQQLRHFVAVADAGNVSRGAERCHISQPSMTTSLKNLEDSLGTLLFIRSPEGLHLTSEGARFLRHAQHVLLAIDDAIKDMRYEQGKASGNVAIAVTDTVTGYFLPSLLATARLHLPAIDVKIEEVPRANIEQALTNGKYDFAIVLTSNIENPEKYDCETLIRSPRRLWTSLDHPLAHKERVSLLDVADCNYVLLDMDEHVETVRKYWGRFGLAPHIVFRSKSIEGVRSLVAQGFGVTILSDLVYRPWSHDGGRIRRKALVDEVPTMDVGLVRRREDILSPSANFLANLIRQLKP